MRFGGHCEQAAHGGKCLFLNAFPQPGAETRRHLDAKAALN